MSTAQRSGGSAAAGGIRYENLVGAWYAVRAIAGAASSPVLNLPADVTLLSVRSQTEAPVDDHLVETSAGGFVFVQCKRKVQLGSSANSALAAAVDQFVLQWIVCEQAAEAQPWARPLSSTRDRLVLATSAESAATVRTVLSLLLQKLRDAGQGASLASVADTDRERSVARQFESLVRRSFAGRLSREPAPVELAAILRLIWIQVLDVEDGGTDARAACETLINTALADGNQASLAWSTLTALMSRFSTQRTGALAATLRTELATAGIALRSSPAYDNDIQKLREWTSSKLAQGEAFTHLVASDPGSAIVRDVFASLRAAAQGPSYLVTGDPGSGKSGVIYELAKSLMADGLDVLFLPVDRLPVTGGVALTDELRVSHALETVLQNWEGEGPAYLVIDALDAARNFGTQVVFRELVSAVLRLGGRWRVIASVRKYDLRFGLEWRSLFRGAPPAPEFRDPEFSDIRHIAILPLSRRELDMAAIRQPSLKPFVAKLDTPLRDLLRTVFNLHLLSQLLRGGAASESLSTIRTQLDLLDRWWQHRVHGDDLRHAARERALLILLESLISQRSLQITRGSLRSNVALDPDMLTDLESRGVLRTTDLTGSSQSNDRIQFAHHILFDYAVARITFSRGLEPSQVANCLASDRDLALVLRPSLHLICEDTWATSRAAFWDLAFMLAAHADVPEVAKLAAPMVAAENAHALDDLAPLLARLPKSAAERGDEPALRFLGHLLGALLVMATVGRHLAGPESGPWSELAAALAQRTHRSIMFNLRILVWKLAENPERWTEAQKRDVGRAGRALLAYTWSPGAYDANLAGNAINAVIKTFDTDIAASRELFRQALTPAHMAEHAYSEMHWIARGVSTMANADADFVAELYAAAFAFRERSDAKTSMGESQILPLSSKRSQDYEMAWFQLSEAFPKFISAHPRQGIRAIARAIEGYLEREHKPEEAAASFTYAGRQAQIRGDHSYTWRQFRHYQDALVLLSPFDSWLDALATQPSPTARFAQALELVAAENSLAGIWTGMISAATRHPELFGTAIADLLAIPAILMRPETTHDIGAVLPAIYPRLTIDQRGTIETAILSLEGEPGERARNILLATIPEELFATEQAEAARAAAAAAHKLRPNRRPVEFTSSVGAYDSRAFLKDEGVDVESDPAKRLLDLASPLKAFTDEYLNAVPKADALIAIWPAVEALWAELRAQEQVGQRQLVEHGLSVAAQLAARAARADLSDAGLDAIRSRVREILFRAETGQSPELDAKIEEQFNTSVGWGSPSARIEAAEGIMSLLRRGPDDALIAAAQRLARDPVAAVRWHIIHLIFILLPSHPTLVWQTADYIRREEDNRGVVVGFLGEVLPRLIAVDRTRAIDFADAMVSRFAEDARPGANQCLTAVMSLFWDLYIWDNEARARAMVYARLEDLPDYADQLHALITRHRATLTAGATDNPSDPTRGARGRIFALFTVVAEQAHRRVTSLMDANKGIPFEDWPEAERTDARDRFRILDLIARELYFASGAYSRSNFPDRSDRTPDATQERFYHEAVPLFELLSKVLAVPVAHHLIQTLEFFISLAPAEVFRLVAASIRTAEAGGYTLEHMGSGLFVRIVERYLADHRDVFANETLRGDLLDALDAFVRAGWPDARALTFKIADIWR